MNIYKTLKTNGHLPQEFFNGGIFIPFPIDLENLELFEKLDLRRDYDVMVIDNRKEIEDNGNED